jgi:hypothetical protein
MPSPDACSNFSRLLIVPPNISTDKGNAEALGLNWSPKLTYSALGAEQLIKRIRAEFE